MDEAFLFVAFGLEASASDSSATPSCLQHLSNLKKA
jgi:hypothetical protein